jgi:hypothetical protein
MVQLLTPDSMRGRVSAIGGMFISASNELGEFESGTLARFTSPVFAVVFGGIGTLAVVVIAAFGNPQLRRYGRLDGHDLPVDEKPHDDRSAAPAETVSDAAGVSESAVSPAETTR